MPHYYLRAEAGGQGREGVVAICYQLVEDGRAVGNFNILLAEEWGECEILKKLLDLGLFRLDGTFIPSGPNVEADLHLVLDRVAYHKLVSMDERSRHEFVHHKLSEARESGVDTSAPEGVREPQLPGEPIKEMLERLQNEGEAFLRRHPFVQRR